MKKNMFLIFLKHLVDWVKYAIKVIRIRLFPKSLLYRFILIILLPLILLQTIILIFFYDRHWSTISRRLAADVSGEIQTVADYILTKHPTQEELNTFLNQLHTNLSLKMYFKPNSYLTEQNLSDQSSTFALTSAMLSLKYPVNMIDTKNKQQLISIQLPTGVLTTLVPRKRFFSSTVYVFLAWMIGSSLLLFGIAFLFMKNQVRSIEKLSKASELFGIGHDIQFKPSGATEVQQAGLSFILMKNRIQRFLSERTAMLAGVSHDLRTPLTRMKLQLSMLPTDGTTTDLLSDISEMEQMLNGYLSFAKGEDQKEPQIIQLDDITAKLIEKQKKTGQSINIHIEEPLFISGRVNDIIRAINNPLTNAARYASKTSVTVGIRNKSAAIIIDDNGPGIPFEKRANVFKAFYRLDKSRNQTTGGIGLGLTITRDIILSHGGEIFLSDSPLGGLRVVISLPLINQKKLTDKSTFTPVNIS